jgi:hypothetical protein
MSSNERTADRRRRRPALGVAAGGLFAGALITLGTAPTAGADETALAVGNAVTADQFSDLLTGEGTQADQAVDNFYQGIANFFAPEAMGSNAVTADLFSDMLTGEGTQADQMLDGIYQTISMAFQPEGPIDGFLDSLFGVSPF